MLTIKTHVDSSRAGHDGRNEGLDIGAQVAAFTRGSEPGKLSVVKLTRELGVLAVDVQ